MAKVMVAFPDDLLGAIDAEAERQKMSRSTLLQEAARREIGSLQVDRDVILENLDRLSAEWAGPLDAAALIRADRERDG